VILEQLEKQDLKEILELRDIRDLKDLLDQLLVLVTQALREILVQLAQAQPGISLEYGIQVWLRILWVI
jgi:hypothetical protein